jgi:hypothetical protein
MRTSADASASKTVNLTMTTPWIDRSESEWDLAPMIAFFACASNQLNYEYTQERARGQYKNVGSLSFAFASALEQLPSNQKTWGDVRRILDSIMATIAPNQTPYSDGDLTLGVFNGAQKTADYQLRVLEIIGDSLRLSGGSIMKLRPGTMLELRDLSIEGNKPVRAEVVRADFLESTARLVKSGSFAPQNLATVSVSIALPAFGGFQARWICKGCSKSDRALLETFFRRLPGIVEAKKGETAHLICTPQQEKAFQWTDEQGNALLSWPDGIASGLAAPGFGLQMQRWAAAIELQSLHHPNPQLDVRLTIHVYSNQEEYAVGRPMITWRSDTSSTFTLCPGDFPAEGIIEFHLMQSKFSPSSWYYSLYAIDECEVTPLHKFPLPERILKRTLQRVNAFQISGLQGMERYIHLKLIACTEQIEFDAYFEKQQEAVDLTGAEAQGRRGSAEVQLLVETFRIQIKG